MVKEKLEPGRCGNLEALKGIAIVVVSVLAFGVVADVLFKSEEKAKEAREKGVDV